MASKVAEAIRMEEAVNRLIENVESLGGTVETPARTPSTPADWAALIDSVSDALEAVKPARKTTTAKKASK